MGSFAPSGYMHPAPEHAAAVPSYYAPMTPGPRLPYPDAAYMPPYQPYDEACQDNWNPDAQLSHRSAASSVSNMSGTGVFVPNRQRRR